MFRHDQVNSACRTNLATGFKSNNNKYISLVRYGGNEISGFLYLYSQNHEYTYWKEYKIKQWQKIFATLDEITFPLMYSSVLFFVFPLFCF